MRCHLIRLAYQRHLHPFLWQSLVGFHLMTTVWNAWQRSRTEGVRKLWSYFRPFVDQSSWNFGTMQETLPTFQRLCEIVYVAFRPEGIRHHHHRHWELIRRPLRCKKTKNWTDNDMLKTIKVQLSETEKCVLSFFAETGARWIQFDVRWQCIPGTWPGIVNWSRVRETTKLPHNHH